MDLTVDQARAQLEAQISPLDTQAEELEASLSAINETRKRLRAALNALAGTNGRGRSKQAKKCVTKDMVIKLAEQLVRDNERLQRSDLEQLLQHKIQEQNYSLSGFALRLNEALATPRFFVSEGGIVTLRSRVVAESSIE